MKKSVEILGLPIISITEGRELGLSKSLLIDAKNGLVAAITIEDEDWYRGVKLIPYESVIAIGADAVTITHSENILKLEDAGDYEALLDENIRVIGTRAITKNGIIQGTVTEIFVGDDGRIEKCEITAPDGVATEVTAEQISIFGKQVTVIESELEKKTELISPYIDEEPDHYAESTEDNAADSFYGAENEPAAEPAVEESFIPEPEPAAASFSQPEPEVHQALIDEPEPEPAELESMMTPEPAVEETPAPVVEELPTVEETAPVVEETPAPSMSELAGNAPEPAPVEENIAPPAPSNIVEMPVTAPVESPAPSNISNIVEMPTTAPVDEERTETLEQVTRHKTQQAEILRAALRKAMAKQAKNKSAGEAATVADRLQIRRSMFLGKHATATIKTDNGIAIVEEGAEITEAVFQKARLANKLTELSKNIQ